MLRATISSIAKDGVSGASVDRITARAGVTRGLVRHYFGSKDTLLLEAFNLLAHDFRKMLGMVYDPDRTETRPELRLRSAIPPMFEGLRVGPERQYAWFGFWALARSHKEIAEANRELYREIIDHLVALITEVAALRGVDVDAALAGRTLAAILEGAWVHCGFGIPGASIAEAEHMCFDYLSHVLGDSWLEIERSGGPSCLSASNPESCDSSLRGSSPAGTTRASDI
jgi:AcrR family transcriptional regulator